MRTLRPHVPALLAVAFVTIASWPVTGNLHPRLDLDGAWQIALYQSFHDGLNSGHDVVFTYGPLGFLATPLLVHPWPLRLAWSWAFLMQLVLVATLLWGLRHAFRSWIWAIVIAIPLAVTIGGGGELTIAFAGAVALAAGRPRGRAAQALALGLGVLAAITFLAKLNTGVTVGALGAIAVLVAPAPRRGLIAIWAGGLLGALVVGWFGSGQSLTAIPDFLTGALGIVSGYSEAMMFQEAGREWELFAAVGLTGIGLVLAWRAGDALPRRSRLGLVALWGVLAFTMFKAGFVRHDGSHAHLFFATLLGAVTGLAWAPHRRQTALLVGALFALAMIGSAREVPRSWFSPLAHAGDLVDQVRLLSDGSATNAGIQAARVERAAYEQFDDRFPPAIGGRTVHVEPTDAGLVWSRGLAWRPLPVFQSYSAYTHALDERNAEMVRSPDGPEVILREDTITFDSRNPAFESPAAMRAILCHFRTAKGPLGRWLMLERSTPRCGRERPLGTVEAKLDAPAPVPPAPDPSSVVIMRIDGIAVSGLEKLRATLYRALPRDIEFEGGRIFRLVPGTAANGIVLRVPRRADYPGPFRLDQATDTVTVRKSGREGDVRLRFSAMSIR